MSESVLTKRQTSEYVATYHIGKVLYRMTIKLRYDDECGNGHNTFSITADVERKVGRGANGGWRWESGGCQHDEIIKRKKNIVTPSGQTIATADLIKWHLCSSDGPMHYVANTCYLAGDRDHWGLRKGEFRQFKDKETGELLWKLGVSHKQTQETIASNEKPEALTVEYVPWGTEGEGKERELDAARSVAIWPEATDEDLTADNLAERLTERLPALLDEFRAMIESLGFTY